jgi:hypothetical protein
MEPSPNEKEMSKVAYLIDELNEVGQPGEGYDRGYHPAVYNKGLGKAQQDGLVQELCSMLQKCEADGKISSMSLELQMWWRDHKAADKARIEFELRRFKEGKDKAEALAKLSSYERKLLGLETQ